jgi:hypothetical protein
VDGKLGSAVKLNSGATLSGTGTVGGAVTVASTATVSPDPGGPGTPLTTGSETWTANTTFFVNLQSTSNFSQLVVNGSINLSGAKLAGIEAGGAFGETFPVIQTDGKPGDTITGTFTAPTVNGQQVVVIGSDKFSITYSSTVPGGPVDQVILTRIPRITPAVKVTSNFTSTSPVFGQTVTFTVTVTPPTGSPFALAAGDTVTLTAGAFSKTVALNSSHQAVFTVPGGAANLPVNVAPGDTVTATFNGDLNYAPTPVNFTQKVVADASTVTITSPNPVYPGQTPTVTVTVGAKSPGAGTPIGTVTLTLDGSTVINITSPNPTSLTNGQATFTLSSNLSLGAHKLTASFTTTDGNFLSSSTATAYTLNVSKAPLLTFYRILYQNLPSTTVSTQGTFTVKIAVRDPNTGNLVLNFNNPITLAINSGPAVTPTPTLGGTTTVNVVNGFATFTNLTLTTPGTYTLVASSPFLTPKVSGNITAAVPLVATGLSAVMTAISGTTFSVPVTIVDAFGHLASTYNAPVSIFVKSGPSSVMQGPTTVNVVKGRAYFSNVSVTTTGTYTFEVQSGSLFTTFSYTFTSIIRRF